MNDEKRKRLREAASLIERGASIVESVMDDEQYAFDNLPESFQDSERGATMEDAIGELEDAICNGKDAVDCIERAMHGN